jgi:hypothetical protein
MSIDKTDHASRRSGMIFIGFLLLLISYAFVLTAVTQGQRVNTFDLVLIGGRVMDPVRNIGVSGGRVSAISTGRLQGREVVDVSGLVVAPGFIDLHLSREGHSAAARRTMKEISAANCKLSATAPRAALAQGVFPRICNRNPIYMLGAPRSELRRRVSTRAVPSGTFANDRRYRSRYLSIGQKAS